MKVDEYQTKQNFFLLTHDSIVVYDKAKKLVIEKTNVVVTNKKDFLTYCIEYTPPEFVYIDGVKKKWRPGKL